VEQDAAPTPPRRYCCRRRITNRSPPDPRRCPSQARNFNRAGTAVAVRNRDRCRDDRRHRRTGDPQQASRQHDDLVGFPRAKFRQSCCRWSVAAPNRCRPPFRCTGRMVASATDAGVRTLTQCVPRAGHPATGGIVFGADDPIGCDALEDRFEFDTPRFESSQPSQPPRSLPGNCQNFAKSRHFRRLVAKSLVSGKESRASRTEGHESGGKSLLDKISISEICVRECSETGCVSAETGANLGESS
jgi:hypothetical protein